MDKVVILARGSTQRQEYDRQVNELMDYSNRVGWSVEKVFSNKVSGAAKNADRYEIRELVEYVKGHDIKTRTMP